MTFNKELANWLRTCEQAFVKNETLPVFAEAMKIIRNGIVSLALRHSESKAEASRLLGIKRTTLVEMLKDNDVGKNLFWYVTFETEEIIETCLDCPGYRNSRCLMAREFIENPESKKRPSFCKIKSQVPMARD